MIVEMTVRMSVLKVFLENDIFCLIQNVKNQLFSNNHI